MDPGELAGQVQPEPKSEIRSRRLLERREDAVELVHLGSLYHDDVIDEAETRRGVPSVNARWSNIVAILSGEAAPGGSRHSSGKKLSELADVHAKADAGDLSGKVVVVVDNSN